MAAVCARPSACQFYSDGLRTQSQPACMGLQHRRRKRATCIVQHSCYQPRYDSLTNPDNNQYENGLAAALYSFSTRRAQVHGTTPSRRD